MKLKAKRSAIRALALVVPLILATIISLTTTAQTASLHPVQLKRLLISDIDDTLKVSSTLNMSDKLLRALDPTTPYLGMSQLFQLIVKQPEYLTKVIYLTNAPKELVKIPVMKYSHSTFLSYNQFPVGEVVLRENLKDENHKINYLRKILNSENVDEVILVGDNSEKDTEVYAKIVHEFSKKIKFTTFIHQVYSVEPLGFWDWAFRFSRDDQYGRGRSLEVGQIGYVTPIEVALELKNQGKFHQHSWNWLLEKILPRILNETHPLWDMTRPITFPYFKNCSDFRWQWEKTTELIPLIQKIEQNCNLK